MSIRTDIRTGVLKGESTQFQRTKRGFSLFKVAAESKCVNSASRDLVYIKRAQIHFKKVIRMHQETGLAWGCKVL